MTPASTARTERPSRRAWAFLPFALGAAALVAQAASTTAAIATGLLFFATGIAHGAADEQDGAISRFGLLPAAAYIVSGLAVMTLFLAVPLAGLTMFLALSAWHFARSTEGTWLKGMAFAGIATGGSMLFQFDRTRGVFAALTGAAIPEGWLYIWVVTGALGVAGAVLHLCREPEDHSMWIAVLAVVLLHPVLAVGVLFLVGHAIPVQAKQVQTYGSGAVVSAQAPATIAALAGAGALVLLWRFDLMPLTVLGAAAFGFATPHMLSERLEL